MVFKKNAFELIFSAVHNFVVSSVFICYTLILGIFYISGLLVIENIVDN